MRHQNDPDGSRLPIKIDSTSNGEFIPRPLEPHNLHANALANQHAGQHAKRSGLSRRTFLTSACGAATTLLAFNQAHQAFGKTGGFYNIPAAAALEPELAEATLAQREFIFDIQGHHVNPLVRWRAPTTRFLRGLKFFPHGKCSYLDPDSEFGHLECFTGEAFVKEMFMDSDTDMAVLTFTPSTEKDMALTTDEAAATREVVDAMEGSQRLLIHGRVIPNLDGDIARMPELAETWKAAAWKTYTQYGPAEDSGWWLDDDEFGAPLLAKARETGVHVVCVHKGLPLPSPLMSDKNRQYGSCRDVGPAARQNPDIAFIIYHSGFDPEFTEGPYKPGTHDQGIDSLIQSMQDNNLGPGSNVYAELGSTWRYLMRDPDQAAHGIGKLLKYVGENNVVWGTDCIWYGSPQDQIQAFRTFQIADELREQYGYPEITPEIRAKVFGLNAAIPYGIDTVGIAAGFDRDIMHRARQNYANRIDPTYVTYGPRTRRELLRLRKYSG